MDLAGFIGSATVSIDAKGRTNLPKDLRKQLPSECKGTVVVTIFADNSLALRPGQEWNRYVSEELEPLSRRDKMGNRFVMKVTSMAKISELDSQNRISLSPELLAYAGIAKEVTFAGDGKRIRLWNPEKYHRMLAVPEMERETFEACFFLDGRTEC
jgi:MraZ protein